MNRRQVVLSAVAAVPAIGGAPVRAQKNPPPTLRELKSLGNERYQVGRIVVDKRAQSFTVPGRVLVLGKPLEYIATSPGGMKDYETLLEVNTIGTEFNLACILIGLERDPNEVPSNKYRLGPRLVGPRVTIRVTWTADGIRRQISAAEALLGPDAGVKPESVEWVYVGAPASDGRTRFSTDETGTLIGVVHDANSIIEAAEPIGLGAYGSVRGNSALVPPEGTPIELIVTRVAP